jgi:hypothetical protein
VSTDGVYYIQGASSGGALCVTVVAASLPGANASDSITVATIANKLFADVTKAQSLSGLTVYHCFFDKNKHATDSMLNVLTWIASNTPGLDGITIGLDPLAASTGGTGPTAVANENTAPAGVTFVNPTSNVDANVLNGGTLTAGQGRFIWIKLLVPPNCTTATPLNTYSLGVGITA